MMIAVAPTASAQSGTAKGTLSVDGNKVVLSTATAVTYRSTGGNLIPVVLSDRAPDAKSFAQDTRVGAGEAMVPGIISGAWKSQHFAQRFSGYTFTSTDAGKVIDEEIFIGGKNKTFSTDRTNTCSRSRRRVLASPGVSEPRLRWSMWAARSTSTRPSMRRLP
ncbi:MAG TPA: hypothetical protein VNG69_09690 [Casimicrobiaceae bacterium]|nr:hypothetical protein [Casimicrobiaceae bacterium]